MSFENFGIFVICGYFTKWSSFFKKHFFMEYKEAAFLEMKKESRFFINGGEGGIRTLGGVTLTRFPIVLLRPARTPLQLVFFTIF
jgi:hypothetical protein